MERGSFVSGSALLEKGFNFTGWFAGYHVYRKQEDVVTYIFYDYIKQVIITIFEAKEWEEKSR